MLARLGRESGGATAVEFALIAPILFGIIFATIDLGRYAWTLSTVQMAADEAARHGAIQNKALGVVQTETEFNLFGMNLGNFNVVATNATKPTANLVDGENILRIKIQHTHGWMFPISLVQATANMVVISEFAKP